MQINKWKKSWVPKLINGMVSVEGIKAEQKINVIFNNFNSLEIKEGFFTKCFYAIVILVRHIKIKLNK